MYIRSFFSFLPIHKFIYVGYIINIVSYFYSFDFWIILYIIGNTFTVVNEIIVIVPLMNSDGNLFVLKHIILNVGAVSNHMYTLHLIYVLFNIINYNITILDII